MSLFIGITLNDIAQRLPGSRHIGVNEKRLGTVQGSKLCADVSWKSGRS
jgi:hypothetical protein